MANLDAAARNSVALQREMFRLAKEEHGLSVAVLARTRDLPKSTVEGWASGETAMPAWALGALRLPDDLTSLVLSPYGKHVGSDEQPEGDVDALAREAAGYASDYLGRSADGKICHIDKAVLGQRARRMMPIARKVAVA